MRVGWLLFSVNLYVGARFGAMLVCTLHNHHHHFGSVVDVQFDYCSFGQICAACSVW